MSESYEDLPAGRGINTAGIRSGVPALQSEKQQEDELSEDIPIKPEQRKKAQSKTAAAERSPFR